MPQQNGSEPFTFDSTPKGFTLNDFWRWRSTYLLDNITRGYLAEFIVANALDIYKDGPTPEWESYDLLFNGKRIEVKTSAYLQSWEQRADSKIRFSVQPARLWDAESGYGDETARNSEMYIFCVLAEKSRELVDPLALDQWDFYPVLTYELSAMLGGQKSVGLSTLCRLCPEPYDYTSLRDTVIWLFSDRTDSDALLRSQAQRRLAGRLF